MEKIDDDNYRWSFFKAGGGYQVNVASGLDIANLESLDLTLWAALSCPTRGIYLDEKTLDLIDTDGDGHIRAAELIAAIKWACSYLKNPDYLLKAGDGLSASDINTSTPEGAFIANIAREITKNLGKAEGAVLVVEDFADEAKLFQDGCFNADGIIAENATDDVSVKLAIKAIISLMGASKDRSGLDGLSEASFKEFFEKFDAYLAWQKTLKETKLEFSSDTEALYPIFSAVEQKIDEYFEYAKTISFDAAAAEVINASAEKFAKILDSDGSLTELEKLPLANVGAKLSLDLNASINPAWIDRFIAFKANILTRLGILSGLNLEDWQKIKSAFAPYVALLASKVDGGISSLNADIIDILANPKTRGTIAALIAQDWSFKGEVENIANLERLVRYKRDLYELIINFVNFKHFYKHDGTAIFQVGKLFFDQRQCDLCISVSDPARHATLAPMSYIYLVYCTCTRAGEAPMQIVAGITSGHAENIFVGRNGLFIDRLGRDWDAHVTQIIQNPINVREAFWQPYKRFGAWIGSLINKHSENADATLGESISKRAEASKDPNAPAKKMDIGTLAAIGVAVGGITSAIAMVLAFLGKLPVWKLPILFVIIILLISLPSMVIAAMKLRLRNLAPLLDANLWAINTKAKISFKLGAALTRLAHIPHSAKVAPDLFAQKPHYVRNFFICLIVVLGIVGACEWKYSFIRNHFKKEAPVVQTSEVKAEAAPAAEQKQEAPADSTKLLQKI